ncbi:MAG: hypothetical protein R3E97_06535 [Candidatus Eisenbacteria bacterium]
MNHLGDDTPRNSDELTRLVGPVADDRPSAGWVDRTEAALVARAEQLGPAGAQTRIGQASRASLGGRAPSRRRAHADARTSPRARVLNWAAGAVLVAVASLVSILVLSRDGRPKSNDVDVNETAPFEEGYLPGFGTLPGVDGYVRVQRR